MAQVIVGAWKCEFPMCGHVWLAVDGLPPKRCAKCKKLNWNKTAKQVDRGHDPATCRVYRCGICAVAKGGKA